MTKQLNIDERINETIAAMNDLPASIVDGTPEAERDRYLIKQLLTDVLEAVTPERKEPSGYKISHEYDYYNACIDDITRSKKELGL